MLRLVCLLIGYLFGMIQSAYLYGRMKGIDIRNYGSGNAGTTNAMRVFGKKIGFLVLLCDLSKSLIALLLVNALFGAGNPERIYLLKLYTIAGCVLGHDYPFYMNFKGGKGVAVMAGFAIAFYRPWFFFACLALFALPFIATHYVSLGSLVLYAGLVVLMVGMGQGGCFAPAPQGVLTEMYIVQLLLSAMAFYKHRANIGRLLSGTENKTYLLKKKA
ncbi:MAG: glycerol-3-phosphate 1-O-acyltransferase PlsY [Lachnospiraceae bacterium]|nr:glycerol-3-phosphate 1-O-acyltransferase PlsY [Lachnospiraceae bacterium]